MTVIPGFALDTVVTWPVRLQLELVRESDVFWTAAMLKAPDDLRRLWVRTPPTYMLKHTTCSGFDLFFDDTKAQDEIAV